jgi:predicted CopG family antitoxin
MKTIALNEQTYQLLHKLKTQQKLSSFDVLLLKLIQEKDKVPDSMFGVLKGRIKQFNNKERKKIWNEQ